MYLAEKNKGGENVVIKKLRMFDMKESEKKNIENEISLLRSLDHPNIVKFYDSYTDDNGDICIVMNYCDGGDLYKKLRSTEIDSFSEEQVLDWIAQMILAINYLHDKKILHRDIKTQNIFISDEFLYLGDFGISKSLENTRDLASTVSLLVYRHSILHVP